MITASSTTAKQIFALAFRISLLLADRNDEPYKAGSFTAGRQVVSYRCRSLNVERVAKLKTLISQVSVNSFCEPTPCEYWIVVQATVSVKLAHDTLKVNSLEFIKEVETLLVAFGASDLAIGLFSR